jgi:hypothetical protein
MHMKGMANSRKVKPSQPMCMSRGIPGLLKKD